MAEHGVFSISDFARFARTTRDALLRYDKLGLLAPACRGENNYRQYSSRDLVIVRLIQTMQKHGVALDEMKPVIEQRSTDLLRSIIPKRLAKINEQQDELSGEDAFLSLYASVIESTMDVDENAITIEALPAESIILGPLNEYGADKDDYDALCEFYNSMSRRNPTLDMTYPVWGLFSKEWIERGNLSWPERYYFYNPNGGDQRPAGLYAVGYARGGYSQNDALFRRMFDYMERHNFEICGDTYVEYPHNEFCIPDATNYLIRIRISVREKE